VHHARATYHQPFGAGPGIALLLGVVTRRQNSQPHLGIMRYTSRRRILMLMIMSTVVIYFHGIYTSKIRYVFTDMTQGCEVDLFLIRSHVA
jgi:hypothetical protein